MKALFIAATLAANHEENLTISAFNEFHIRNPLFLIIAIIIYPVNNPIQFFLKYSVSKLRANHSLCCKSVAEVKVQFSSWVFLFCINQTVFQLANYHYFILLS